MLRRAAITTLLMGAALGPSVIAIAQQGPEIRITGRARDGQARFRLVNRGSSTLTYTTYDGGNVHNSLERQDHSGAWADASPGYCGLGQDGVVSVPPGGRQVVLAYVGRDPGTYRIRVRLERVDASGATVTVELVSPPFTVA